MLELRPTCENCNKSLPPNCTDAMICSFECTYCKECVDEVLQNVCPNCGGGFVPRPIRPKEELVKYPATQIITFTPLDEVAFESVKKKFVHVLPVNR